MAKNLSDGRRGPLVELEALHKLLDRLKPEDLESTNAWYSSSEPCCKEIVSRFKNLLDQWTSDENKLNDLLANDDSLTKCEYCGVIRCVKENVIEKKTSTKIAAADIEDNSKLSDSAAKPIRKYTRKQEIMRNSHPVPRPYKSDLRNHLDKTKLSSNRRSLITKEPLIDIFKAHKNDNNKPFDEINLPDVTSSIVDKSHEYQKLNLRAEKYDPFKETMKQLIREKISLDVESTPNERLDLRKINKIQKQSFDIHGSRDTDLQENAEFFIYDRLRREEAKLKNQRSTEQKQQKNFFLNSTSRGSETSAFSSSSAENLIHQWIKPDFNNRRVNLQAKKTSELKNLSPCIAATRVIKNVHDVETETIYDVDQNINCNLLNENNSKMKSLNDNELHGVSRVIKNAMWDETKIEETFRSADLITKKIKTKSMSSVMSEKSEQFQSEIVYDDISSKETICDDSMKMSASKVLLIYRKILESNEEMDWESFEHLVTALHPSQRDLWCDICKAVSNEAKRVAEETGATTEVCIEINPHCNGDKKKKFRYQPEEISFELDMTMKDIHGILEKNYSTITKELKKSDASHVEK